VIGLHTMSKVRVCVCVCACVLVLIRKVWNYARIELKVIKKYQPTLVHLDMDMWNISEGSIEFSLSPVFSWPVTGTVRTLFLSRICNHWIRCTIINNKRLAKLIRVQTKQSLNSSRYCLSKTRNIRLFVLLPCEIQLK